MSVRTAKGGRAGPDYDGTAPSAPSAPSPIRLLNELHARYDGPVPEHLLAEVRAIAGPARQPGGVTPIPHDATLIVSALVDAGGESDRNDLERRVSGRLSGSFAAPWKFLLDSEIVRLASSSYTSQHAKQLEASSPKYILISYRKLRRRTATTSSPPVEHAIVNALVGRTVDRRNFAGDYQAVVIGQRARADPVQKLLDLYAPIDRADLWQSMMGLDVDEQAAIRRRAARIVGRGGRD